MTQLAVNSEEVATLFAERQRYETWLSTLEAKRATTPAHIYNRVHADYTARLQRAVEQLATHRVVLQEMESNLTDRLTSLDIEEVKHRDEAAEAELRSTVGELTAEQHQEVMERTAKTIAEVSRERTQLTDELTRLQAILEAGGIAPSAPRTGSAPVEVGGNSTSAPPPPRTSGAVRTSGQLELENSSGATDWDLSFEQTPEPKTGAAPQGGAPRRPSAELKVEQTPKGGPFDDLEFLKSMTDSRSSGENVAIGSGVGGGGGKAQGVASGSTAPQELSSAQSAVGQPGESAAAKDSSQEQVKTLKCQECGTLNYPTEWYCERCGAELAAL